MNYSEGSSFFDEQKEQPLCRCVLIKVLKEGKGNLRCSPHLISHLFKSYKNCSTMVFFFHKNPRPSPGCLLTFLLNKQLIYLINIRKKVARDHTLLLSWPLLIWVCCKFPISTTLSITSMYNLRKLVHLILYVCMNNLDIISRNLKTTWFLYSDII